jgi:hypothetical protein
MYCQPMQSIFMNKIAILGLALMDLNVLLHGDEFPPMLVGAHYDRVRLSYYKNVACSLCRITMF